MAYAAGVLTVSDGCARGDREDASGQALCDALDRSVYTVGWRGVVEDDRLRIASTLREWCRAGADIILTTGGTGLAPRDVTPEATADVINREAPGLAELLRASGLQKTPRAALSRGRAGVCGTTLIINLPGSPKAVVEGMEVLTPLLPHALALLRDEPVDHTPRPANAIEQQGQSAADPGADEPPSVVTVIETNLDDLSPEFYEILVQRLFDAGALDVFMSAIQMKKSRPGTLLTVIAAPEDTERLAGVVFTESSSFGVRYTQWQRLTLRRHWVKVETDYGSVRIKVGEWQGRETAASPEYADVKAAALAHAVSAATVYAAAQRAYHAALDGS